MLKIIHKIAVFILPCTVLLTSLIVFSGDAWAAKSSKSVAFDASTHAVEVVAIYDTSFATQKSVIKALKLNSKLMKKAPGFKGFSVLRSQHAIQLIALSQWEDLKSYKAYATPTATEPSSQALEELQSIPTPTRTLAFQLEKTQASMAGAVPAIRGKEAVVQFVKFMPKSADDQMNLLNQAEAIIPTALQRQPIPQSALLLKGVDNAEVALLLNWNCSAMFEDLGKPSEIPLNDDLTATFDVHQQFYDVVKIIPAEVEKPKDEDKPEI